MTGREIGVDRPGIYDQLNTFGYIVGELEGSLSSFPVAANGGGASNEIGLIVSAIKAQAERVVAAEQGLSVLTLDVLDRLLAGDKSAADLFDGISETGFDD